MTLYADQELAALLQDQESQLVERKRSGADRSGIRKNICAFANDLPGTGKPGVIFVGVENDGGCAGIQVDDELLRTLAQIRSDGNILPLPSMTVEKKTIHECDVAAIQVEPAANPPVRYQGRVWVKVGPTVQQATPEEEQRLTERRRSGYSASRAWRKPRTAWVWLWPLMNRAIKAGSSSGNNRLLGLAT